jgi:hypothetical protein
MMLSRVLGPAGAPPPSDLFYPTWVCYVAPEAGPLDVDARAGLSGNADSGAPAHASATDAGSQGAGGGGGGGGCDLPAGESSVPGIGLLLMCVGGAITWRRRSRGDVTR